MRLVYPHRQVQTRTVAEQLAVVGVLDGLLNLALELGELAEREAQRRAGAVLLRVSPLQDELEEVEREDAMLVSHKVGGRGITLRPT